MNHRKKERKVKEKEKEIDRIERKQDDIPVLSPPRISISPCGTCATLLACARAPASQPLTHALGLCGQDHSALRLRPCVKAVSRDLRSSYVIRLSHYPKL